MQAVSITPSKQTDWKEIRNIRAEDFKQLLRNPIVIDGRRTYEPAQMIAQGIQYYGIGWKNLVAE